MKRIDKISTVVFNHLVHLAALELTPEESIYLQQELNSQLRVIEELTAVPLDASTVAASHGVPYNAKSSPSFRLDQVFPSGISQDILEQTPETEADYIVVPEIPHETLE